MSGPGVPARIARWFADREFVPTAHRAVLGYYAETGTLDHRALDLKSRVDEVMDEVLADLYADVEAALAREFGVDAGAVAFEYETKLTMPAELTLGYLFRRALSRAEGGYDPLSDTGTEGVLPSVPRASGRPDGIAHRRSVNREAAAYARRARETTAFVVRALLDGDMRDAINDDEFEDFVVEVGGEAVEGDGGSLDAGGRRVARVAQSCLQTQVEAGFAEYPDGVRAAYDHAVAVSEAHQAEDDRFRELMAAARARADGSSEPDDAPAVDDPHEAIEQEYKFRRMTDNDHPFTDEELALPYLTTQYDRVGVIYHGMLEMYRAAGFEIEPAFERSIVFAIVGAQVWLDDVDDYYRDVDEGQLTPVTAEYLLADADEMAFEAVVELSEAYFDHARTYADAADSTLTGLAVEYVLRSGDASHLPGATRRR